MSSLKKRWLISGGTLALVAVSLWWWLTPDPQVAQVQAAMKQLESPESAALTPQQRQTQREAIHQQMEVLTPAQRRQVFAGFNPREERVNAYFALPPEKRVAFLDDEIKRMEEWRPQREPGGPHPGGPGGPRGGTPQERQQHFRNMLDHTTGEQRGRMMAFHEQLRARRQELGLPNWGGPEGPPPGP